MGRNAAIDWLPHYREVLVATAVRALGNGVPDLHRAVPAAARRVWLSALRDEGGWRAVAVAAGAIAQTPVLR